MASAKPRSPEQPRETITWIGIAAAPVGLLLALALVGDEGVLISDSHDSEPHRERVLELAQRLRGGGVDAWIDQFEPAPVQGWLRNRF
jgi:hypothetical protein